MAKKEETTPVTEEKPAGPANYAETRKKAVEEAKKVKDK